MTVPQFSRPGAIDLSALRKPAAAHPAAAGQPGSPGAGAGGSYTLAVTSEQSLHVDVVERSVSVVVLVSFWSPEVPASVEINATLSAIADEYAGRFLFATVDVAALPDLAQALGIPQVPLVVAALRGQLAPLPIQASLPDAEMRGIVDQILQAAAANGVTGTVQPVGAAPAPATEEPPAEPVARHPEAEAALMSGDLDRSISLFEDALKLAPGDVDASLGLSQAQLLKRTKGVDPVAARAAAASKPDDVAALTLAADLDLLDGSVDDAFARLIDAVRRMTGDDRDAARQHLIEMFAVVGDADPRVAKARQQLASALF